MYYANEESGDVIGGSTKTVQHSIKNISRNIVAVSFKLGTRTAHHKKQNDTRRFVAMTTVMPLVLKLRLKFPDFILNKDHPLVTYQWGEVKQYRNDVCSELDPLSHFKRLQTGIIGFSHKETGAKIVAMATT